MHALNLKIPSPHARSQSMPVSLKTNKFYTKCGDFDRLKASIENSSLNHLSNSEDLRGTGHISIS